MSTNLPMDENRPVEAEAIGKPETNREDGREGLVALFGTIDYDPDYDYKAQRKFSTRKAMKKVDRTNL